MSRSKDPTVDVAAASAEVTPPSTQQFINISNYMYSGQTISFAKSGLESEINLKPLMKGGKAVATLQVGKGLFAEAFVTTGSGPKQVIIGYQGTSLYKYSGEFTGAQTLDDAAIFAGRDALSYKASAHFAKTAIAIAKARGIGKSDVFVTGHSLGAAEAEYAGMKTGLAGDTFGTPGILVPNAVAGNPLHGRTSKLTNYVDYGDPVGNYAADGPDPFGPFVLSQNIQHYGGATLVGPTSNQGNLTSATAALLAGGQDAGLQAAVDIAENLQYHHLTNYVTDLKAAGQNVTLFAINGVPDGSVGADDGFFSALTGAAPTTSTAAEQVALACFAAGTAIRTERGDVPVEALAVGDLVLTTSGALRPVRWLGHRTIDCRRHERPDEAWPVRIAANAFGDNRPRRDLHVSPNHAICVDMHGEVLIPAIALVNGETIVQVEVARVTYWHVELETHDVILAENMPAESYLEMGNRGFFAEAEVTVLAASPDALMPTHADFCRPFHAEGAFVESVRARLLARASQASRGGRDRQPRLA